MFAAGYSDRLFVEDGLLLWAGDGDWSWLSPVGALSAAVVFDGTVVDGAADCAGEDSQWAGVVDAAGAESGGGGFE